MSILTPRQTEILDLLTTGASNVEIAEALHVSESTVKATLQNIKTRLPASVGGSRTAMAIWWVHHRYSVLRGVAQALVLAPEHEREEYLVRLREALNFPGPA